MDDLGYGPGQFNLRRLFGITTVVAVVAWALSVPIKQERDRRELTRLRREAVSTGRVRPSSEYFTGDFIQPPVSIKLFLRTDTLEERREMERIFPELEIVYGDSEQSQRRFGR